MLQWLQKYCINDIRVMLGTHNWLYKVLNDEIIIG